MKPLTEKDRVRKVAEKWLGLYCPKYTEFERVSLTRSFEREIKRAERREREASAKVAEDMTKEQEYKTIGHLCDNRCEWERGWTKKVVASAIRQRKGSR